MSKYLQYEFVLESDMSQNLLHLTIVEISF